ncbi:FadR/GntR family transcriptional regulator [Clostridium sediminicola]|uniref:FadR/GntR family transcriptional regulator n=1 Tax=Clostridium sediminicola TaxID=3114879 RepID=UPI0031F1EEBC
MFTPIKNAKIYEQVIEQIKEMIRNGTLKKGDKLPSERELTVELGVSRSSIREALRALEIIGLLESRQGEGNFIRNSFDEALIEPLSIMFMLNESSPLQIFELRQLLEIEIAKLAATKIKKQQISDLTKMIKDMRKTQDEEEKVILDKQFHYLIANASGNNLIINILFAISCIMDRFIKEARRTILLDEKEEIIHIQHSNILAALESGDENMASKAMKEHMDLIKVNLKSRRLI